MKQSFKPYRKQALIAAGLVLYAMVFHLYGRHAGILFWNKLFNFIRTFSYMGLFAVWGISVSRRVVQPQARRCLIAISALTVFWLGLREWKFRFAMDPAVLRFLWYCYYIPILLIPTLALLVTITLHRPEGWRLPRGFWLLLVPAAALIALVLTNDSHQWAFVFPPHTVWSEQSYTYGPVFYLTVAWDLICSGMALLLMFVRCRVPKSKKRIWLPAVLVGISLGYTVLYALNAPIIRRFGWDLTVCLCLLFTAYLECCIVCGLIPSNFRYYDFFHAMQDIAVQITDDSYRVYYSSAKAEPIDVACLTAAERQPVTLPAGRLLRNMAICGGHAVWTEDISALLQMRETLQERQEELSERQSLLRLEYEKEKNHHAVTEQNRLYNLLQSQTQSQLDQIHQWVGDYRRAVSPSEQRRILSRIVVLGTFVKRRKDFVLLAQTPHAVSTHHLRDALAESFHALSFLSIGGGFVIAAEPTALSEAAIPLAYDFFKNVLESVLERVSMINVRIAEVCGKVRINVMTDCPIDRAALTAKYPCACVVSEDDGAEAILALTQEGGTAP